MTSDVKIQRLVFLTLLSILGFAVIISNVTYSQKNYPELHEKTIDEIVKHSMSEQNPSISVEDEPWKIVVNQHTNIIYVDNVGHDTVSVIGAQNSCQKQFTTPWAPFLAVGKCGLSW